MNGPICDYPFEKRVPDGDNRERLVCSRCGWIHYENPQIVVGAVVSWDGRVLLCRRSIEPRRGFWTIPAGYLEQHETTEAGARREALEEAHAEIEIESLLAVYSIPRISQIQLIYRARLKDGRFQPGVESLETRLFARHEIPWDDLAFPSVHWALRHDAQAPRRGAFTPFHNPPEEHGEPRR